MDVFIIGITGKIGRLLARELLAKGDTVHGLVRRDEQRTDLATQGIHAVVGDLTDLSVTELADAFGNADAVVFTAGSNGGSAQTTKAIDGDGVTRAIEATRHAGIQRLALVSVLPESWRERDLDDEVEYYFTVKKQADVALSRSDLDWLILRPSLLTEDPGVGTVSLGPAEFHGQIPRADVAATLAELLHEPHVNRRILELNTGTTPIQDAVKANARASDGRAHVEQGDARSPGKQ
ncbi:SDR family oxidoreductase [Streptomyces sp. NPDC054949]|uniref:SDR family oxidoreductase n=1 Tax=unclassified Streptomyces TaxID=2593676 RepID=UPI002254DB11|nr:SDR family oxidoreductase [Streptomyces sp. NBC_00424]MCX5077598.1 SDR family oxidoreductase [Streptomyces sp. NBC_00424]WUD39430.1 SDR family oxidoreductase [Streptomyces sp. NBC_00513]